MKPPFLALVAMLLACASSSTAQDGPRIARGDAKYPAISLAGLGDTERQIFEQIVDEEVCPCDCPKSFGACLRADTKCRPAVLLANWMIGQLAEGVRGDVLAEQIAAEIGAFSGPKHKVETRGYSAKGPAKARYTIVEYADFECAHCKAAAPVMTDLARRHPDKVRVVFKHYPLEFHAMAKPAARATEAAAEQGKFWEMHDAVFATQNMLDENLLLGHAKALGLNQRKFQKDYGSKAIQDKVSRSRAEGERIGVLATPTFLVNGRPFNLMRTRQAFELRFAMEDARAKASCR